MTTLNDPKFWDWLKEKESTNKNGQIYEQIPLPIPLGHPGPVETPTEHTINDESSVITDNIIFQF